MRANKSDDVIIYDIMHSKIFIFAIIAVIDKEKV